MNRTHSIILAFISLIVIYFSGFFHGKKRLKELKEENAEQKKILEKNEKIEKEREEINEIYDKAREHLGNNYTSSLRTTPKNSLVSTQKATLFPDSGKV